MNETVYKRIESVSGKEPTAGATEYVEHVEITRLGGLLPYTMHSASEFQAVEALAWATYGLPPCTTPPN